jgi:hypothetical protein
MSGYNTWRLLRLEACRSDPTQSFQLSQAAQACLRNPLECLHCISLDSLPFQ